MMTGLLASCGTLATSPPTAPGAAAAATSADMARVHDLTRALAERDKTLNSVQSGAVMAFTSAGKSMKAKEQIVARRPSSLRVEAMSPFGVALILAARGSELEIFEPSQKRLIRANATAETLNQYVQIPMEPRDAVGLLMGLAPADFDLGAPPASVSVDDAMTVAVWPSGDAATRQLGFTDGLLTMVRETAAGGAVHYEVRYSDYHDIGGVMFPYTVDADFPAAKSHVTLRYQRPIVNGEVPDSTFVLTQVQPPA